jgi:alpha-beta hydrolase superfamily lysophospholipase
MSEIENRPQTGTTVVFVHGLWITPRSWEHWAARFEGRGQTVLAASWPGVEGEVEELNRDPSPIARLDMEQVLDHYDRIIRSLESPRSSSATRSEAL